MIDKLKCYLGVHKWTRWKYYATKNNFGFSKGIKDIYFRKCMRCGEHDFIDMYEGFKDKYKG